MNDKKAPWQRNFEAFAGPGIYHPSEMMKVGDSEAAPLLAEVAAQQWQSAQRAGEGRHAAYTLRNAAGSWTTALFHEDSPVGFYRGSTLWIAKAHRGLGLHVPLILAAAEHRGGGVLPPGIVFQGYTAAGIAAHRDAHRHAVSTALARGLPVPAEVLEEMRPPEDDAMAA